MIELDSEVTKLGTAAVVIAVQQAWIWSLGKQLMSANKRGDDWAREAFTVSKEAVETMTASSGAASEMSRSLDGLRSTVAELRSAVDRAAAMKR